VKKQKDGVQRISEEYKEKGPHLAGRGKPLRSHPLKRKRKVRNGPCKKGEKTATVVQDENEREKTPPKEKIRS